MEKSLSWSKFSRVEGPAVEMDFIRHDDQQKRFAVIYQGFLAPRPITRRSISWS
jgi:hypothetical protein